MEQTYGEWIGAVRASFEALRSRRSDDDDDDDSDLRLDTLVPMQFEHDGRLRWAEDALNIVFWRSIWQLAFYGGSALAVIAVFFRSRLPASVQYGVVGFVLLAAVMLAIYRWRDRPMRQWLAEAQVVSGVILMADGDLEKPGLEVDANAILLFTFDRVLGDDADRLLALADVCVEVSEQELEPGEPQRELWRRIRGWSEDRAANDPHTFDRVRVPSAIAGNDETWVSLVGISQEELPGGVLDRRLLPVLAREERNETVQVVPCSFWPEESNGVER